MTTTNLGAKTITTELLDALRGVMESPDGSEYAQDVIRRAELMEQNDTLPNACIAIGVFMNDIDGEGENWRLCADIGIHGLAGTFIIKEGPNQDYTDEDFQEKINKEFTDEWADAAHRLGVPFISDEVIFDDIEATTKGEHDGM